MVRCYWRRRSFHTAFERAAAAPVRLDRIPLDRNNTWRVDTGYRECAHRLDRECTRRVAAHSGAHDTSPASRANWWNGDRQRPCVPPGRVHCPGTRLANIVESRKCTWLRGWIKRCYYFHWKRHDCFESKCHGPRTATTGSLSMSGLPFWQNFFYQSVQKSLGELKEQKARDWLTSSS